MIASARKKISAQDANAAANPITTAKAPQRGNLVIPGTKEADKSKDDASKDATGDKAKGGDLFTAVVGVETGEFELHFLRPFISITSFR